MRAPVHIQVRHSCPQETFVSTGNNLISATLYRSIDHTRAATHPSAPQPAVRPHSVGIRDKATEFRAVWNCDPSGPLRSIAAQRAQRDSRRIVSDQIIIIVYRQRNTRFLHSVKAHTFVIFYIFSRQDARRGRNRVFCFCSCSCACGAFESPRSFSALSADLKRLRR